MASRMIDVETDLLPDETLREYRRRVRPAKLSFVRRLALALASGRVEEPGFVGALVPGTSRRV